MRSLVSSVLQSTSEITDDPFKLADEALRDENSRLTDELSKLRQKIIELEHMADMDPLVPLYNRRAFMRELSRALTVRARYDICSAVIYFDLDDFKAVNDRFGHAIGDNVLKSIGQSLASNVRDCDVVARLGGDEFAALLFKTDIDQAMNKAVAITQAMQRACAELSEQAIQISVSWGVADCVPNMEPENILSRADRQMFTCKAMPALKLMTPMSPLDI
jgi:diguanylate cyclase (GGDEF)-like protein